MQNQNLELSVIKKFIIKDKQDRYIQFISSEKNRHKFINELAHFKFFKIDKLIQISNEKEVLNILSKAKIDTSRCYIISENNKLDKKNLDTKEVLNEVYGYGMGSIIIFGNADIIYYEGEDINSRYIIR